MSTLSIHELSKAYKGHRIVDRISLEVQAGEVVGLLGPNGAGKTTCFHLILGLIKPDSGRISLNGRDLTGQSTAARARLGLGYLPQEASIFRKLSVADNILGVIQAAYPKRTAAAQKSWRDQLMAEFQLEDIQNRLGLYLSGGERRRVEIARALATSPRFILLDEPFAGVDPISMGEIKQIIRDLVKRQIGVLITDHNVRETLRICQKAYILNAGHILAAGKPVEILADPQVKAVYLGEHFQI